MATLHLGAESYATDGVDGKVGIATTSPTQMLEVAGEVLIKGDDGWVSPGDDANCYLGDVNHAVKTIRGGSGTEGGLVFQTLNASDHSYRFTNTSDTELIKIKADTGATGIGITEPNEKLEVNGNIKVDGNGNGIILTSPDGSQTKKLRLSNSGTLELV